jgi:hypothetical protein
MKNFNLNYSIYGLAGISIAIYLLLLYFFPPENPTVLDYLRLVPMVLTIDFAIIFIFTQWAWKISFLRNWLVKIPDLNGTWKGLIKSNWVNSKTNEKPDPIPVILTINQTLFHISCVMRTEEMTSYSFVSGFEINEEMQIKRLVYSYNSRPGMDVKHRSPEHFGTMLFDIIENSSQKLKGEYWTDRNTIGIIEMFYWKSEKLDYFPEDLDLSVQS